MHKAKHSIDKETLRFFWRAAMVQKHHAALALLFPIGAVITTVVAPLIIGKIIAGISTPGTDVERYIPYLAAASILGIACNRIGAYWLFTTQAEALGRLQEQAFQALVHRSIGFHNNNVGGKLVSDAIDYSHAFGTLMDSLFVNLFPLFLVLVSGSAVVFSESWQLGLIVTIMCGYTLGSTYWSTVRRSGVRRHRQEVNKAVTSHIADSIVNVATVKTFAKETFEMKRHHELNRSLTNLRIKDWRTGSGMANTRMAVLLAMQLLFIVFLIQSVKNDPAVLGIGIFAFTFITTLSIRLIQLHPLMRQIEDGFLEAAPMTQILLAETEVKDAPDAKQLHVTQGAIELHAVKFGYKDTGQTDHVFSQLSLVIKPGEKIGLVGPSGGGKSTLTKILLRFEDINEGSILIDGQDIAQVSQQSLREAIAYVPQEPLLFHRSIRENIAYGTAAADENEIITAARRAHAHEFIVGLPQGYDTIVGERGVKLSGGQRQRIAIARAILKNAPILMLDEATSALDSSSEKAIQQALNELMKGKTAIVIAHRLSTIQRLDRIIVLDGGVIVEQGSHQSLVSDGGLYATLWKHQSGGFIDD